MVEMSLWVRAEGEGTEEGKAPWAGSDLGLIWGKKKKNWEIWVWRTMGSAPNLACSMVIFTMGCPRRGGKKRKGKTPSETCKRTFERVVAVQGGFQR